MSWPTLFIRTRWILVTHTHLNEMKLRCYRMPKGKFDVLEHLLFEFDPLHL